jgi:hypothetical protein
MQVEVQTSPALAGRTPGMQTAVTRLCCIALLAWGLPAWAANEGLSAADLAEMQRGMQEAQKMMRDLDPETRRQLESMMQQAGAGSAANSAPARNPGQLSRVNIKPMSPAALKTYIAPLPARIAQAMDAKPRQRAEKVEAEVRKDGNYLPNLRAAANGLAAIGAWPEALWLTSRLAQQTGHVQDLSNLAAMLTLLHAETAALPLLHTLDARYPGNSTILNNLGQAYFQLGESATAEKFLLAAVRRAPVHPQANATRARIQMDKGDKVGAQASLHAALQGGYSPGKENQLRQAGGKLTRADVAWKLPLPPDPLGAKSTKPTLYPDNVDGLPELIELERTTREAAEAEAAKYSSRAQAIPPATSAQSMAVLHMPFAQRVGKLMALDAEADRKRTDALNQQRGKLLENLVAAKQEMDRKIASIDTQGRKQYANVAGGYQFDYSCGEVKTAIQKFINDTVPGIKANESEWADVTLRQTNNQVYFSQFVLPASEFQRAQLSAKASFTAGTVGAVEVLHAVDGYVSQRRNTCWRGAKSARKVSKLREFNDIHCAYITELKIPNVGTMAFRCDTTEVKLEPALAPFEAAWTTKYTGRGGEMMLLSASASVSVDAVKIGGHSEFDESGWTGGGVNVGVSSDLGGVKSGPLEVGVEASATVTLEFDRNGLSDASVKAGIEAKTSSTLAKTDAGGRMQGTIKAGAESTLSYNAGYNGEVSKGFNGSAFKL